MLLYAPPRRTILVDNPQLQDVLSGRHNGRPGNEIFRKLCQAYAAGYSSLSYPQQRVVVDRILDILAAYKSRFLNRMANDKYCLVTKGKAARKIQVFLRSVPDNDDTLLRECSIADASHLCWAFCNEYIDLGAWSCYANQAVQSLADEWDVVLGAHESIGHQVFVLLCASHQSQYVQNPHLRLVTVQRIYSIMHTYGGRFIDGTTELNDNQARTFIAGTIRKRVAFSTVEDETTAGWSRDKVADVASRCDDVRNALRQFRDQDAFQGLSSRLFLAPQRLVSSQGGMGSTHDINSLLALSEVARRDSQELVAASSIFCILDDQSLRKEVGLVVEDLIKELESWQERVRYIMDDLIQSLSTEQAQSVQHCKMQMESNALVADGRRKVHHSDLAIATVLCDLEKGRITSPVQVQAFFDELMF